ncbi:MAG: succinyl-diaminopimelate desuccinylase [Gammaproteobacteria bacterium]|nr:succinyl-diaminopimelate desuccinylase [Gammaproteobacteria bacterium]
MSATLDLTRELIARESVTPADAGCQALLGARLAACGFELTNMPFEEVTNLWARRGQQAPLLVFAGHTDVVPTGPLDAWSTPPFEPTLRDGMLFGRGAADMKSSLAAMVTAVERFTGAYPQHRGSVALLLTSDEEGPSVNGTVKVVERLSEAGVQIDWCVVGEPTSVKTLGDMVKNGRRGSMNGRLKVQGIQGHVAYPARARNPIHLFAPALTELSQITWDEGSEYFPPTTFQISNINAGTGAQNVVPGHLDAVFNFRFSTAVTIEGLQARVREVLDRHGLEYTLSWRISGYPFITPVGQLVSAVSGSIEEVTGTRTELSTTGGTSDGRFIAPTGAEVVELGPVNATIHQVNEAVRAADLDVLSACYEGIMRRLLAS